VSNPREIKFRVWDKNQKRMRFLDLSSSDFGDPSWLNAGVLMQYTGLTDRHGVEIYEGDIASYETSTDMPKGEIVPISGGYSWKHAGIEFYLWDMYKSKIKVIGNVWENKDLLK